jgi:hypothetical protein
MALIPVARTRQKTKWHNPRWHPIARQSSPGGAIFYHCPLDISHFNKKYHTIHHAALA